MSDIETDPNEVVEKEFVGMEKMINDRIASVFAVKEAPAPKGYIQKMVARNVAVKENGLGLTLRKSLVTRVASGSPFKGTIQTGDIIFALNGIVVSFDNEKKDSGNDGEKEKDKDNEKDKTSEMKKITEKKNQSSAEPVGKNMLTVVSTLLAAGVKFDIAYVRLKTRVPCKTVPKAQTIDHLQQPPVRIKKDER